MILREFISALATVSTIGLYLTGIPICRKIVAKGSTQDTSFFPLIVMFCNTTLWVKYALIKDDPTLLYANSVGSVLTFIYVSIYYLYTTHKTHVHRNLAFGAFLLFPILIYVKFYADNLDDAVLYLGFVCSSVGVMGYGAPLSAMSEVLRTKSTECMAFPLSLANFIVAIEWFSYGFLLRDFYIQVPNLIGIFLGGLQLALFWKYPSKKQTTASAVL
ncbi:hypothetical protein CAPTEDRAFT_101387 [Capitella teleta]|uniref:Sugar transporter SWEET1 n=1 Tax=Capitella teleta TaxID=283909 RepID=R7TA68_CAPTE|nr:hypothetical protein CAPTEDRAFT_101387 [Capitella teleta]|eukprot:ELT90609.1 hypothetical protein CAPTEDRAFT_101387 [Capitella teleta]